MKYKLIKKNKLKDLTTYQLLSTEDSEIKIVSKDQLCFLVGKGEVEGLTAQLYQGKL